MKTTLLRTATSLALLALSIPAFAEANVSLYGRIDTGLQWMHTQGEGNTLSMEAGQWAGSRWGIRGSEDLGNGYGVAFDLESSIATDNGGFGPGSLFYRESSLTLKTPVGDFGFGRMGGLVGSVGTYGVYAAWADAFATSFTDAGIQATFYGTIARLDNTMVYRSPEWAGFRFSALHSLNGNEARTANGPNNTASESENITNKDRTSEVALSYKNGPLTGQFVLGHIRYRHDLDKDPAKVISAAVQYDFGVTKLYLGGQLAKNVNVAAGSAVIAGGNGDGTWFDRSLVKDGRGIDNAAWVVGTNTPLAGGCFTVQLQGARTTVNLREGEDFKGTHWVGALGYYYNLSKRTTLYSVYSYGWGSDGYDHDNLREGKHDNVNRSIVQIGVSHAF